MKKTVGYSGTSLAKKLGIKNGYSISVFNSPKKYSTFFFELPSDLNFIDEPKVKKNFIHYFALKSKELENDITTLKNEILSDGMIWVSWPKKTSKIFTDLDRDKIREIGLKNGLVDVKICAIDDTWSGLKFVIPVKERS